MPRSANPNIKTQINRNCFMTRLFLLTGELEHRLMLSKHFLVSIVVDIWPNFGHFSKIARKPITDLARSTRGHLFTYFVVLAFRVKCYETFSHYSYRGWWQKNFSLPTFGNLWIWYWKPPKPKINDYLLWNLTLNHHRVSETVNWVYCRYSFIIQGDQ